jgi:tetratricopeptide (TPR) repeat protein
MDAEAYYTRGLNQEDLDQAIADFTEAIRIKPDWANVYDSRGCTYANKKEYDKAIADFNEAIRIYPEESMYFYHRGNVYEDKKNYSQAIADHTEAIRIDSVDEKGMTFGQDLRSTFAKYYGSRGRSYFEIKKFKEAIADFENALKLDPDEEMYRNNLEVAKASFKRSRKWIWIVGGAAVGGLIGGIIGGGYGVFFGAIIGAFPLPIIRFIWSIIRSWLSKP